jgi:aryl-alcohol dehydrogenase-like predicted oxidoreductase
VPSASSSTKLHAVDPQVDLRESLGELIRLRQEGKILHIGLSNVSTEEIELALRLTPIASVQNRCNPFEKRDFKKGLVELCAQRGITYFPTARWAATTAMCVYPSTPSCGNYQRSRVRRPIASRSPGSCTRVRISSRSRGGARSQACATVPRRALRYSGAI